MVATDALVTFVNSDNCGISPLLWDVFTGPDFGDVLVRPSYAGVASMFKQFCLDIASAQKTCCSLVIKQLTEPN